MVGRLVEQQQIGAAHQRLGEMEAHAPAAGKLRHRRACVGGREAQAVQQFAGARARRVAADRVQALVQRRLARGVVRGLGRGEFAFEPAQFGVAVEHVIERGAFDGVVLLAHVGQHPVARTAEIAAVEAEFTADQREQAALAAAVAAGQADTPARMNEKTRMVQ